MNTDKQQEMLPFIEVLFTPSEASEILSKIIESVINFCSIQQWSEWEKNHSADLSHYDVMKSDLELQKSQIKELIKKIKSGDQDVKVRLRLSLQIENN